MFVICYRLLDLVENLNKSYVVWQEIFDNGLKVTMYMNKLIPVVFSTTMQYILYINIYT